MRKSKKTIQVPCSKCDGKGSINGFGHIENGKCFRCGGARVFEIDAEKFARDLAEQEKWAAHGNVDRELVAWTGGYGSVDAVAQAIIAYGGNVKALVSFYTHDDPGLRAQLAAAYRRAKAASAA